MTCILASPEGTQRKEVRNYASGSSLPQVEVPARVTCCETRTGSKISGQDPTARPCNQSCPKLWW